MIKHVVFFMYMMAFATGCGTMILGFFLYCIRIKHESLKYGLLCSVFFTLLFFCNTLQYYGSLIGFSSRWFIACIIYGIFFATAGTVGCLTLVVSSLLEKKVSARQISAFFLLSCSTIGIIFILRSFNLQGFITDNTAAHAAFFSVNLFGAVITYYNALLLWHDRNKLVDEVRFMAKITGFFVVLLQTMSLIYDLSKFRHSTGLTIAFSPIIYFTVHSITLMFAARFYMRTDRQENKEPLTININTTPDYYAFCQKYCLTARELEIIRLVAEGHSNQEIGEKLYISLNTVRNHIYNVYKKLGVKSRYELFNLLNGFKSQSN